MGYRRIAAIDHGYVHVANIVVFAGRGFTWLRHDGSLDLSRDFTWLLRSSLLGRMAATMMFSVNRCVRAVVMVSGGLPTIFLVLGLVVDRVWRACMVTVSDAESTK